MEFRAFARRTLVAGNILFIFVGVAVIVLGIYGAVESRRFRHDNALLTEVTIRNHSVVIALVGAFLVILSAVGVYAALQLKRRWLVCHSVFSILAIALLMAVGVAIVAMSPATIDDVVEDKWYDYRNHQDRKEIQNRLHCCGYKSIIDHVELPCTWIHPCRDAIWNFVHHRLRPVGIICTILGGIHLLLAILTCIVVVRKEAEESEHVARSYTAIHEETQYGPRYQPPPAV